MECCPTCRSRVGDAAVCGRCQSDLSQILAAEATAAARLRDTIVFHLEGHGEAARQAAMASLLCKDTTLARVWLAFLEASRVGNDSLP